MQKSYLFGLLEKVYGFLVKIGISKNTPGAFKIYNFLFKKSWPYGETIEISGSKMYVDVTKEPSISLRKTFESYAINQIHEKTTTELFKKYVKEGNTVVDLGANIGYFSLLSSKLVGKSGRVFSFEPEPKNFKYLSKNIEINGYSQDSAFQKAVSDKNGKTKLYICSYDTGHHTINQHEGIESYSHGRKLEENFIEIDTITLDSFMEGKGEVNFIKIDVEGAEMLALMGMDRVLRENKDIKLVIEFFPLLIEKMGNSPREFIDRLIKSYGFSMYVIPGDYNATSDKMEKINNADDAMTFIKDKEDHINLFLIRE